MADLQNCRYLAQGSENTAGTQRVRRSFYAVFYRDIAAVQNRFPTSGPDGSDNKISAFQCFAAVQCRHDFSLESMLFDHSFGKGRHQIQTLIVNVHQCDGVISQLRI